MKEVNVKVAVRVRPLLPKEKLAGEQACVRTNTQSNQIIVGKDRSFTFDYVLGSKILQDELYQKCVEPLVEAIFSGYNATVFAYGQTGSGKTYTIGGANVLPVTEEEMGIIPRAICHMYDIMQRKTNVDYSVSVSYVEIYKEEVRDLLDLSTPSKDLHIRENDHGQTMVVGAREVRCDSMDEVLSLIETGSAARHTGSTRMNECSSRSHALFTILIGQSWMDTDATVCQNQSDVTDDCDSETPRDDMTHHMSGKFHFVDLAGSERAHRTGNVGDRFKESIHINTGLLGLGNVISALSDPKKKATHIPYRDSKITRLLKDSLGGNAETLMICCISPCASSFDETLNALKYANRAKNIKNRPVVNRDSQSLRFEEMQTEIKALREELARQRSSVMSGMVREVTTITPGMDNQIRHLDEQIIRLQTECSHYKSLTEQAYLQLNAIQERNLLSQSLDDSLREWLDLVDEVKNKVPIHMKGEDVDSLIVKDLKEKLRKCKSDLKSDEEIFTEKSRENEKLTHGLNDMEEELKSVRGELERMEEVSHHKDQQLLDQQMTIDQLRLNVRDRLLSVEESGDHELSVTTSEPAPSKLRPLSEPAHVCRMKEHLSTHSCLPPRTIHTSPAQFSMERLMRGFRARTQLLISRLEENDTVLQPHFSDDDDEPADDVHVPEKNIVVTNDGVLTTTDAGNGDFVRRGTYRIKNKDRKNVSSNEVKSINNSSPREDNVEATGTGTSEQNQSNELTNAMKKQVKQAQLKILASNQKMRDLAVNIKMKEQLIRELVKTGKNAEIMNKQYEERIHALEKEKKQVKAEVSELQKAMNEVDQKYATQPLVRQSLHIEYKEKIAATKARVISLQKKQRETEKVVNLASQTHSKISSLEESIDRMKKQSDALQRKLKFETERKLKLEKDMQKDQQRIKDLEIRNEKQQKLLKRKNEEIAAVQRKLRSTLPPVQGESTDKLEEQRRWLDDEMEKMIRQRRQMEAIEVELAKREDIIAKRELMLKERDELEMKKLRSSQMINKDMLTVASRLNSVEQKIATQEQELLRSSEENQEKLVKVIEQLKETSIGLQQQQQKMDEKLKDGSVLTEQEERRLIELEEAIETMEAAIEYKTEMIDQREKEMKRSHNSQKIEEIVSRRLDCLSVSDTRSLLIKYFSKVVNLRESEHKSALKCSEMEMKVDEQERLIRDLESALERSVLDIDRKLTMQQREYEGKLQILLQQLNDANKNQDTAASTERMRQLEKDVYYYRKTSRDLKQKIRDLVCTGTIPQPDDIDIRSSHPHNRTGIKLSNSDGNRDTACDKDSVSQMGAVDSRRDVLFTPVKMPQKAVRMLSEEEVSQRVNKSQRHNEKSLMICDSLEMDNN